MANEKRLTYKQSIDGFEDVGLREGVTVGEAICKLADLEERDAVEVVYCKDCKSHHWEQEPCHGKTVHICSKLNAEITRDFYCGAGERKDNERTD